MASCQLLWAERTARKKFPSDRFVFAQESTRILAQSPEKLVWVAPSATRKEADAPLLLFPTPEIGNTASSFSTTVFPALGMESESQDIGANIPIWYLQAAYLFQDPELFQQYPRYKQYFGRLDQYQFLKFLRRHGEDLQAYDLTS